MSLELQWQLESDPLFVGRVHSATIRQAQNWKNSGHAAAEACAWAVLRGNSVVQNTFVRLIAADVADRLSAPPPPPEPPPENGDGEDQPPHPGPPTTPQQPQVEDNELQERVNNHWSTVTNVFFADEGQPR